MEKKEKITLPREKVTLSIDAQLWKEVKHYCIDNHLEYSSFVEQLVKEKLKKNFEKVFSIQLT